MLILAVVIGQENENCIESSMISAVDGVGGITSAIVLLWLMVLESPVLSNHCG